MANGVRKELREWPRRRDKDLQRQNRLRAAIKEGVDSGPGIPAEQVFADLRARFASKD